MKKIFHRLTKRHTYLQTAGRVWTVLSSKLFAVFIIIGTIAWLMAPRIPGILKLLSFIDKDFIDSTSEYIYESTQTHPELQVRIGNKTDPQGFYLALFKEEANIVFTGVEYQVGQQMVTPVASPAATPASVSTGSGVLTSPTPTPSATPQVTPEPNPPASQASESASPEAPAAIPPQSTTVDLTATPAAILEETASTSATPVSQPIPLSNAVEKIDQSFLGTYEKLTLQGGTYPTITYHWEGARLVETWNITTQNAQFSFLAKENGLQIKGENNQIYIFKDTTPIIELTATIQDASGAETTVTQALASSVLTLSVSPEWITSPERIYPLTLRRNYQALANNQIDQKTILSTQIPAEYAATVIEIPSRTQFLTAYKESIIFFNQQNQTIYSLRNGATTPLFILPEKPLALSCGEQECLAITIDGMYPFTISEKLLPEPESLSVDDKIPAQITPIGGYSQTQDVVYTTQNTNPGGTLNKKVGAGPVVPEVAELNYAGEVATSPDGTTTAFWGNGMLYIRSGSQNFTATALPSPPTAISVGNDGAVYSTVVLEENISAIARTKGDTTEFLSGLKGELTSVLWKDEALYVAYTLNPQVSYLLTIPLAAAHWEPL